MKFTISLPNKISTFVDKDILFSYNFKEIILHNLTNYIFCYICINMWFWKFLFNEKLLNFTTVSFLLGLKIACVSLCLYVYSRSNIRNNKPNATKLTKVDKASIVILIFPSIHHILYSFYHRLSLKMTALFKCMLLI